MSKQNLEMLEEIFKGAKMGMNATKLVMDKTKDTDLKNKLTGQYGSFSKTAQKAEEMLISNNKIPEESGMMEKAMLWSSAAELHAGHRRLPHCGDGNQRQYHEHSQHDEKAERAAGSLSGGSDAG